jgi:hypothetical protein
LRHVIGSSDAPHWMVLGDAIETSISERRDRQSGVSIWPGAIAFTRTGANSKRHSARQGLNGTVDRCQRRHFDGRFAADPAREQYGLIRAAPCVGPRISRNGAAPRT